MNIPGDIIECGVFKGSGMLTWLKLKNVFIPNMLKKVVGFDMFDTTELVNSLHTVDKENMRHLFSSRGYSHDTDSIEHIKRQIHDAGFSDDDFILIKGNINKTATEFVNNKPGLRISLLYLDFDLETPTFDALEAFWERVSIGGVVVFDEYGYYEWSEANGVDRFFRGRHTRIHTTNFKAPTAFVVKK